MDEKLMKLNNVNNQNDEYSNMFVDRLPKMIKNLGVDNPYYSISYEMMELPTNENVELMSTACKTLSVLLTMKNKMTGEGCQTPIPVVKVPVLISTGIKIDNTIYQPLPRDERASGWYILEDKTGYCTDRRMELFTIKSNKLVFTNKNNILKIYSSIDGHGDSAGINLAYFLKAITGMSFIELSKSLGMTNKFIAATFSVKEPTMKECTSTAIKAFTKSRSKVSSYDINRQIEDLKRRVFSPKFLNLDATASKRAKMNSTFLSRALNKTLGRDLELDGIVIKEGTLLSEDLLRKIDEDSTINTLFIRYNDRRFELKKYEIGDKLSINELFTFINMYACSLDGYDIVDSRYSMSNRYLATFADIVCNEVSQRLNSFTDDLEDGLANVQIRLEGVRTDEQKQRDTDNSFDSREAILPAIIQNATMPPLGKFLESLKRDYKEMQGAETTNSLSFCAKSYKTFMAYNGRAVAEMTGIKEDRFGRFDPFDAPESAKVGLVNHRTLGSSIDKHGFLTAMYFPVVNGVVDKSKGVVNLTSDATINKYIACWSETFETDKISCRYNDRIVTVDKDKVDYIEASVLNTMGPTTMMVPFAQHSNGKRLTMESNQAKQAPPVICNSRPIVSTGGAGLLTFSGAGNFGVLRAKDILSRYYTLNSTLLSGISYEDFCELPIKLTNMEKIVDYKILNFEVFVNDTIINVIHNIPYMQRNIKDCLYSMRLRYAPERTYQGDDIVAYNIDMDIEKYNLDKRINLGQLDVDEDLFDIEWGPGLDLHVGWKTFGSSTMDDGITISDEVVDMDMLTSVTIKQYTAELERRDDFCEYFGSPSNTSKEYYLEKNGLPKLNTYLKPGSRVIAKYSAGVDYRGCPTGTGVVDKSVRLDAVTEGEVVYAAIQDGVAVVQIASLAKIEEGDKIAGRHGNKGVIARVVPKADMPFDPVTGKPLQIILSPLGVPSRMNIGQVLEAVLAYAGRKQNKCYVLSPKNPMDLDIVKSEAEKANIKPMILRDGRTGQDFKRPMAVGYMYFWKLEHMVRNKITAVGIPQKLSLTFNQPMRGRAVIGGGGQAIGEMETWVFKANGCDQLLQDFFSLYSDDYNSRQAFEKYQKKDMLVEDYGDSEYLRDSSVLESTLVDDVSFLEGRIKECHGESHNDLFVQYLLRSLGVDISSNKSSNSYSFKPLTNNRIKDLAREPVDFRKKNWLHDPIIFGLIDNQAKTTKSRSKWGYMELYTDIVHPLWVKKSVLPKLIICTHVSNKLDDNDRIIGVDEKIKPLTSTSFTRIIGSELFVSFDGDVKVSTEMRDGTYKTGMPALVELLRLSDFETTIEYYNSIIYSDKKSEREKYEANRFVNSAKFFIEEGIKPGDFVISYFPIMPQIVRVPMKGINSVPDFDILYETIAKKALKCKNAPSANVKDLYDSVLMFTGLASEKDKVSTGDKNIKNLLNYFVGKNEDKKGVFRVNLLSKRISNSFRSVIIPIQDSSKINTKQAGIPFTICVTSLKPSIIEILKIELSSRSGSIDFEELLNSIMTKNLVKFGRILGEQDVADLFDYIKKKIIEFIEKQVVVLGRQPSLHKYSARGFQPVVVETNAIQVHPLVCSAYNADFDGDQMWGTFIIVESSKKQVIDNMMTDSGLINPKDNSMVIDPAQDIVLGSYFATMLYNNVVSIKEDDRYSNSNIKYYNSVEEIDLSVKCGNIEPHDLVCYYRRENDRTYISTAGRILFNALLPDGFTDKPFTNPLRLPAWELDIESKQKVLRNTEQADIYTLKAWLYSDLKYDGLIKKKKDNSKQIVTYGLSKIVEELVHSGLNGNDIVAILHRIMEFGLYYSDISAISFTLDDLVEHPETDNIIAKAKALVEKVELDYSLGLMSNESRKETIITINANAKDYLEKIFLNPSKGSAFTRNNNIFILSDSGARGNLSQVMQTCGLIGVVKKSSTEMLESPVMSNYFRGLNGFDMELTSYGTRDGFAAQQIGTADAGYLTRQCVFMTNGFKIVEHDCGKEVDFTDVEYDKPRELVDAELIGRKLVSQDDDANKYLCHFLGIDKILTKDAIDILYKNHIGSVIVEPSSEDITNGITENKKVDIKYNLDPAFASLLFYREVVGYQSDDKTADNYIAGLKNNKYLTKESIAYIEKTNIRKLRVRLMLDCNSKGGCCAKCFGLKFDKKILPTVGENIAIETAQSIGEPSAQLKLDTVNKGSVGSKNEGGGLNLVEAKLHGSLPKSVDEAIISPYSGYVDVSEISNTAVVSIMDYCVSVHKNNIIVKNKEYVKEGQPLTAGLVNVDHVRPTKTDKESVYMRQLESIKQYYNAFASSDIDINARHFEILVREQSSIVKVYSSDCDWIPAGELAFVSDIDKARAEGYNVDYIVATAKQKEVTTVYGGSMNTLFFEDIADSLASITFNKKLQSFEQGFIGKIGIGQDITKNKVKQLSNPKNSDKYKVKEDVIDEVGFKDLVSEIAKVNISELDSVSQKIEDVQFEDLDSFDDLFDDSELDSLLEVNEDIDLDGLSQDIKIDSEKPENKMSESDINVDSANEVDKLNYF